RAVPDGDGGWLARDSVETVGENLIHTRRVDPAIDGCTTASIVGAEAYVLDPPLKTGLGPVDLPTYFPLTRVLTLPNADTVGGLLPEVTARVRVP
ncbi:MAG TPA: hypothetical protein PKE04_07330, partial [Clostridia bacterium]|nr:hypothetical protein [Clostridia bacterium]